MIFATVAGNVGKGGATLRVAGKDEVCSFSVASSKKGKDGKDETIWVDVSLWGARGKALQKYINQGDKITVVGDLYTEEYQGKTKLRLRASDVALQGGRGGESNSYSNGAGGSAKHTSIDDTDDVFGDVKDDGIGF